MLDSGLPRVLLRRWYIAAIGLILTVAVGLFAFLAFPATHRAESYVLVTPPKTTDGSGGNPLLGLGGMTATADVLSRAMTDSTTVDALRKYGVADTYTVTRDLTTDGPVVIVTTTNKSAERALLDNKAVVARMAPTLVRLQDELAVPGAAQLSTTTIDDASKTSVVRRTQERMTLVALALGLLFTVLSSVLADRLLLGRTSRQVPREVLASDDRDPTRINDVKTDDSAPANDRSLTHVGYVRVARQDDG